MNRLTLANLHHAYARLAPRERLAVAAGAAALVAFVLFMVVHQAQAAKISLREKIAAKERQLERVQSLSRAYFELKRQTDAITTKNPNRSPNWLYSTIDSLVNKNVSHDKIQSMSPSRKSVGDQYVEEAVNVQLVGVTLQQTVTLLYELEQSATPLHVPRLQMKKRVADPYQFDVTFAVSSIQVTS